MRPSDEQPPTPVSLLRWLLNLPFLLLWHIAYIVVRLLITMRRWITPGVLLIVLLVVPLLGFSLPRLDRIGSYLMVAVVVALAFVAGKMSRSS
jgi:hypothetical protein